jgi:HK97 gp10 family phage protein
MIKMEIHGLEDVQKILEDIAPKRATNLITATIRGVASEIRKEMKGNAPKDTSNLIKSIKVKKSRSDKFKPVFKVVFDSGKDAKHDGFYWRFVEHGQGFGQNATNFVRRSRLKIESNLEFYIKSQFSKKLESAIKRELKRQAANK